MKLNKKHFIFIFTIYIIYIYLFKGYISFIPTLPIYPDNKKDVIEVKNNIIKRSYSDIKFFYLTNNSIVDAFLPFVNESREELEKIALSHNNFILLLKYVINRPRPEQIDKTIKPLNKKTAMTPSYPAGHSYQAYLLYKHLIKKYPIKKNLFKTIALRCDDCRVKAGLHYVSDGEFSRKIVDFLLN